MTTICHVVDQWYGRCRIPRILFVEIALLPSAFLQEMERKTLIIPRDNQKPKVKGKSNTNETGMNSCAAEG